MWNGDPRGRTKSLCCSLVWWRIKEGFGREGRGGYIPCQSVTVQPTHILFEIGCDICHEANRGAVSRGHDEVDLGWRGKTRSFSAEQELWPCRLPSIHSDLELIVGCERQWISGPLGSPVLGFLHTPCVSASFPGFSPWEAQVHDSRLASVAEDSH